MNDVRSLEEQIIRWKHLYYNGIPEVSDYTYDKKEQELRALAPHSPVLSMVGYPIKDGVVHEHKMLSIQKALTPEELKKWFDNTNASTHICVVSHKIDGLAVELIYKKGVLARAVTRGDGEKGEDVTANVLFIDEIPKRLEISAYDDVRVRGEIFMSKSVFNKLKEKDPTVTDARNLAVGSLKAKDPRVTGSRKLSFFAYKMIVNGEYFYFDTMEKEFCALRHDFKVVERRMCGNYSEVMQYFSEITKIRETLDYKIDGIVVNINRHDVCSAKGFSSHHPKYAICLKFEAEEATTTVKQIEWSMSRTGTLTPVVVFDPVVLAGATITRAKGHNVDFLSENNIYVGGKVTIVRSGDVIPKIIAGDPNKELTKLGIGVLYPAVCPFCAEKTVLTREAETRILKCINNECYKRVSQQIEHYCKEVGIKGIGEAYIESMVSEGKRTAIADLYTKPTYITNSVAVANKIKAKVMKTIGTVSVSCFISGFGIPDFSYNSVSKWMEENEVALTKEFIMSAPASIAYVLGNAAYQNIREWFNDPTNRLTFSNLWDIVKPVVPTKREKVSAKLNGAKFCITGTLSKSRPVFENLIKDNGGVIASGVSSKLDYLICGESAGSKQDKAISLGVKILSEADFMRMI